MTTSSRNMEGPQRLPGGIGILLSLSNIILLAALLCGCKTTDSAEKPPKGSVTIRDTSLGAVKGATREVFESHGFKLARMERDSLVFERPSSGWNNLAYGNWMESKLWDRFKVKMQTLGETTILLYGTSHVVRDRGGATEEEIKTRLRKQYPEMLQEVAARLNPGQPQPKK